MCDYVKRKELIEPKNVFNTWIQKVKNDAKNKGYDFSIKLIGSGSRNMVIRRCDNNYFDLDYQIILEKIPDDYNWNKNCKEIKDEFRYMFNKRKPQGFIDCKDRSQSLRTKNKTLGYGFDIIITTYGSLGNFYILFNKKDTNSANNNDYEWEIRKNMNKYHERISLLDDDEKWNYLREVYKNARHKHMNDQEPRKHSFQLLNEEVVNTLEHFKIRYPK